MHNACQAVTLSNNKTDTVHTQCIDIVQRRKQELRLHEQYYAEVSLHCSITIHIPYEQ